MTYVVKFKTITVCISLWAMKHINTTGCMRRHFYKQIMFYIIMSHVTYKVIMHRVFNDFQIII